MQDLDQIISLKFLRKNGINITVTQVYTRTTDVEQEKTESFYARIQEGIEHIPVFMLCVVKSELTKSNLNTALKRNEIFKTCFYKLHAPREFMIFIYD